MSDFWFNCDSCGRQNVGVTFVNGMRFCAKCYQETFGNTNAFEKELKDKIADLEAKLAESEEKLNAMETLREMVNEDSKLNFNRYINTLAKNEQLEQQLAEKEKENNELVFIIEEIEQFAWEQLNNENFDKYKAYDEMLTKIRQLTKQSPYEKEHQDKISFCIEQLNLLYKTLTTEDVWREMKKGWWLNNGECKQLRQLIDNQIEELKKEKICK